MLVDTVAIEDADLEIVSRPRPGALDTSIRPKRTKQISSHLRDVVFLQDDTQQVCKTNTEEAVSTENVSILNAPNEATEVEANTKITNDLHQASYNDWSDLCEKSFYKMKICAVCGQSSYYNPHVETFALSVHAKDTLTS